MPDPNDNRTTTEWPNRLQILYRRPPGLGWLLALATIPLLLWGRSITAYGTNPERR